MVEAPHEVAVTCPDCGKVLTHPVFALVTPGRHQHEGWRLILLARHRNRDESCPGHRGPAPIPEEVHTAKRCLRVFKVGKNADAPKGADVNYEQGVML